MSSRSSHLLRTYGITEDQYDELLEKQNQSCFICERHKSLFKKNLCVDHNHKTGEVRGLLCDYCNRRVIGRHSDPLILRRASEYLSQGTGWFVPVRKRVRKVRRPRIKKENTE